MELDPLFLSRVQFAFVVSFHAIFPAFTIGLAAYIAYLETRLLQTGNVVYEQISRFWIKIFAVVFAMGVVSGIVMSFQFGTNWSAFSYASANFLGPVLSYEVITAFFLEATFLGVLLFGRERVPKGVHLFAAYMVAIGTFLSSFWILSANAWMQTPAGVELRDGVFHLTSWGEAIFNPSLWPRFFHMALASILTAGFAVAGVSAWYLLRSREVEMNRLALGTTMWVLLLAAPGQLIVGDIHGLNTFEHQPMKVAAMEGVWETGRGVPFLVFAIPDPTDETNRLELKIPYGTSLILTHELTGEVPGLTEVPAEERPPVGVVFWSFRLMIVLGLIMIGFALAGAWLRWRGRMFDSRRFLTGLTWMIPAPFVAVLAGWFVAEVGRVPWLVYGMMTHAEGVTPALTGGMALFTLIGYVLVYAAVFTAGIYYILRMIKAGPESKEAILEPHHPKRPLSAAETPIDSDGQAQSTR